MAMRAGEVYEHPNERLGSTRPRGFPRSSTVYSRPHGQGSGAEILANAAGRISSARQPPITDAAGRPAHIRSSQMCMRRQWSPH